MIVPHDLRFAFRSLRKAPGSCSLPFCRLQ